MIGFQHREDDEGNKLHRCPRCHREFDCWLRCGCDAAYGALLCMICYGDDIDPTHDDEPPVVPIRPDVAPELEPAG